MNKIMLHCNCIREGLQQISGVANLWTVMHYERGVAI